MSEINWEKVARDNNLSVAEFEKQMYAAVCCMAAIGIDSYGGESMKFSCSDDVGKLELIVNRVDN